MTQAEHIFKKNKIDALLVFDAPYEEGRAQVLAAIQDALEASYNVKEADRKVFQELRTQLAAKEKELQELREAHKNSIIDAWTAGCATGINVEKGFDSNYKSGKDYYTKTFTNER